MQTHYLHYGMTAGLLMFPTHSISLKLREHEPVKQEVKEYKPRYFEDIHYMDVNDVKQITTFEALYLQIGEVMIVRSENVPQMEDHFAVISGPIENKEHGIRPQTISIATSPHGIQMLDLFEPKNGVTLLKLSPRMRDAFHAYHNAKVENGNIHCLISKTA